MAATAQQAKAAPQEGQADPGVLAASGLVAGEGLAGILVAGLIALRAAPRSLPPRLPGALGESATLLVVALLCLFLARARERRA